MLGDTLSLYLQGEGYDVIRVDNARRYLWQANGMARSIRVWPWVLPGRVTAEPYLRRCLPIAWLRILAAGKLRSASVYSDRICSV